MRVLTLLLLLSGSIAGSCAQAPVTNWENLLNQKLSKWDMYLGYNHKASYKGDGPKDEHGGTIKPIGYNKNEANVFSVVKDNGDLMLKVTGNIMGVCLQKLPTKIMC